MSQGIIWMGWIIEIYVWKDLMWMSGRGIVAGLEGGSGLERWGVRPGTPVTLTGSDSPRRMGGLRSSVASGPGWSLSQSRFGPTLHSGLSLKPSTSHIQGWTLASSGCPFCPVALPLHFILMNQAPHAFSLLFYSIIPVPLFFLHFHHNKQIYLLPSMSMEPHIQDCKNLKSHLNWLSTILDIKERGSITLDVVFGCASVRPPPGS